MAVILSVTMLVINDKFLTNALQKKTTEITEINSSIAKMILEKRSALLTNSIEDMEFLLSTKAELFLKEEVTEFENKLLELFDESFAKHLDIFFFRSIDGEYTFDASSPFYDTSRIRDYMVANAQFLQSGIRIIQSESAGGTLVALTGSSEAVSPTTGELAGYFYTGIILNNSTQIISEIINSSNLSEAALIYGDSIIAGSVTRSASEIIQTCYNLKQALIENNQVSYCSDIDLGEKGISLKFYQNLPDTFISSLHKQNRNIGYISITVVIILTIILGYLINLATVRSLYRLVDYTKLLLSEDRGAKYSGSMIYEFNFLAARLANVTDSLTETQAYLKNLINSADAPIAIWDSKGNITLFNEAIEKLSGYKSKNVVGKHLSHIYKVFPQATVPIDNSLDSPMASRFESTFENYDTGVVSHVIWSLTDVFKEGEYSGAILQGIDITERKEAEAQLELASKVFENTLDGMIITDEKGLIVSTNKAFYSITGYSQTDAAGSTYSILQCEKHDDNFYSEIKDQISRYGRYSGEVWLRKKDGDSFPAIANITSLKNNYGEISNYIFVIHDITERKNYEEHIRYQATHDNLTGLPNRFHFTEKLAETIDKHDGLSKISMLFLDIDRFKNMNDTLGHTTGDRILEIISERLRNIVDDSALAARFSGDEFGILFTDSKNKDTAAEDAKEIVAKLAEPIIIQDYELFIQMSGGMCFYPENGKTATELIKNSEIAMYKAKQKGRNNLQHFTSGIDTFMKERLIMESKLNRALENNELSLHYQPKIDLSTDTVMGMEALLRWDNEDLGSVKPDTFIPVAEDNGLILSLGEWVISQALEDTAALHQEGFEFLKVAVNLSLRQFMQRDLISHIKNSLKNTGVNSMNFEFEITENIFSEDLTAISKIMREISELNVNFAIDDFGTGYSSIGYLKKMPINTLKIDRSYIGNMDKDTESETIVSSVILMAKSLGLSVVAEGAEKAEQVNLLRSMGCNIVQGYYFGKPMPLDEFRQFLINWK